MKRKSVGYFEGTDPVVLTSLICDGCDTIPVSNGVDNHGRHIRLINEESKVDLLLGYLHKIYAPDDLDTQAEDVFHVCDMYQIPFLVIVPRELHRRVGEIFVDCADAIQFVDPADVLQTARTILKG